MKYIVILGDGMADYPLDRFNGLTALGFANTPNFDYIAANGTLGLARTIPEELPPGSDTANMSVLGYDPRKYYSGRSPFEAASLGVDLSPEDVSFRCNLVTLSEDDQYQAKTMTDYCSGEISTAEAGELIKEVSRRMATEAISFYRGFNYRHLMVWHGAKGNWDLTPPHDISGKVIGPYLPRGNGSHVIRSMMEESYQFLQKHPVNLERVKRGLNPANSIWIWGAGKKPLLPTFAQKYGLTGAVISAVDLIKGIGLYAGLEVLEVEGATGNIDTNYEGKREAALSAVLNGNDFVYIHIEAPDECAHRFEHENKVKAIELIDQLVAGPLLDRLRQSGEEFSILLVTDHATPLSLGTHTHDPVPFAIYRSTDCQSKPGIAFTEQHAAGTGLIFEEGFRLMDYFLKAQQ